MGNLKEIKTTAIGLVLFLLPVLYLGANFDRWHEYGVADASLPLILILLGIGFMLAPDRILNSILNRFKNGSND